MGANLFVSEGIASVVNPDPNQYEEKDVEVDTNYFHEESLLNRREALPEELIKLNFDGEKITTFDELREELFLSSVKETNTITSRAQEMGLFSEERDVAVPYTNEQMESTDTSWNVMILVLGALLVIAVGAMVFLLVKFGSGPSKKQLV